MTSPGRREVVVTGIGALCSQAASPQQLFDRIRARQSSIRNHALMAEYGLHNPACAYIDEEVWTWLRNDQAARIPHPCGPQARMAIYAAEQALSHSRLDLRRTCRKSLFVASNKYTLTAQDLLSMATHCDPGDGRVDLDAYIQSQQHGHGSYFDKRQDLAALVLDALYDFDGMAMTSGDACAAGGIAIGNGYRYIRDGEIDVALAGATEAMCNYIPLIGFRALGALCQQPSDKPETLSRPFDKNRSGFVMGEGSAFLVLEALEHAERRGATILARVSGFAKQMEAWRVTASPADGSEYARCMRAALDDAGLQPEEIDHINAHGTSTRQNDSCESAAIQAVFGRRSGTVPVTSNKSALGHSLAASGAIEAVLSVMSLQGQVLLPTLNYEEGDETTHMLNIVTEPATASIRHVISHSFGFGGENCALVLSSPR